MKTPFNLYDELKNNGFNTETKDEFGGTILTRDFEKEVEVVWYGKQTSRYKVQVRFSADMRTVQASYYKGSFGAPDKTKTHLNDRRALNAIRQTIENAGFAI